MLYEVITEFVALSNHKKVIHCEMAKFASQFRNGQIALIQELFNSHEGNTFGLSARLSALLLHALASEILFEESFGLCNGHDEARDILRITSYNVCYTKLLRVTSDGFTMTTLPANSAANSGFIVKIKG